MQKDYFKEISDIKNLMNRSTRFISLSGLSGIIVGVYAIIGAAIAYFYIFPSAGNIISIGSPDFSLLILDLALVAAFSVITAVYMTTRKARYNEEEIWDATTRRLLLNFLIPLVTGGIYILIQLKHQHYGLSAALMLIFYGLALVNASKYTLGTVKYLGYLQIVLGLICAAFPGYGFYFWVLGFGILHIIYGSAMYANENKQA